MSLNISFVPGVKVCGELALPLKGWLSPLVEVVSSLGLALGVVVLHGAGVVVGHLIHNDDVPHIVGSRYVIFLQTLHCLSRPYMVENG